MTSQNTYPDSGLEDRRRDKPEIDPSWVREAPLKLVAAALYTMPGHSGKSGDIRKVLENWVEFTPKWNGWWKQVRPMLTASEHFAEGKSNLITALRAFEDIPAEPLSATSPHRKSKGATEKPPSKLERDWLEWFQCKTETAPSRGPTKEAQSALDKITAESVAQMLNRVTGAAGEFVASGNARRQRAPGWARLLSQASARWLDCTGPYSGSEMATPVGATLARLVEASEFPRESGKWLIRAGVASDCSSRAWQEGFAAGIWQAIDSSEKDGRQWLRALLNQPGAEHRTNLIIVKGILPAAFVANGSATRLSQIDGLLALLPDADRIELLWNLIVQAAYGTFPKRTILDSVSRACHSMAALNSGQGLNLLVLAVLLLSDDGEEVVNQASQRIVAALENPSAYADSPVWDALLDGGRRYIADLRACQADEMERQRAFYEGQLEKCRHEEERLKRQAQRLSTELDAGREASKLDIRQDMLTVMSETLQSLRQSEDSPERMLRRVEAGLALALRAGDAEEFGAVGETVPYDPTRHQAEQRIPLNAAVRISYPGAVVRGKLTGDRVILKAQVVCPTEVN